MRRSLNKLIYTLSLFVSVSCNSVSAAEVFESWSYECKANSCFISQLLLSNKGPTTGVVAGMSVAIASKQRTILTLRFTNDAEKSAGVGLKIDNERAIHTKILACDSKVCETNIMMDEKLISEMLEGQIAQVAFMSQTTKKQITLPFSLKGYAPAFRRLNERK
ncbi:hypothetical protein BM523_03690 [Alteromonas mediterranea]|uniref:Invasion associated locus B family protein n=1 Tax=Alteromonas mediterranea TaxID=314275 RepID=A0AAC9NR13_9ALTE|nr:invasion associated locus B family protein [Alteromonas mediterranea]APD88984.1 hypothetical protein BM524_03675 [Alteromonas mediterranea]APD93184.1 hypothetical protein BM523_03690 [Alteromonas mediterranea]APD96797.1 hypothetical protein BM525_03675 [Alteromonas mediterranea]QGX60864.1 hypothetical protein FJN15_03440 [Alteromonas mediterranea]